jgi:hypothetical protein
MAFFQIFLVFSRKTVKNAFGEGVSVAFIVSNAINRIHKQAGNCEKIARFTSTTINFASLLPPDPASVRLHSLKSGIETKLCTML